MRSNQGLFVWLLLILAYRLGAQQVVFRTYNIHDGLVSNQVTRVAQAIDGFIWIATWEGLSKYDGHKFSNYHTENGLCFDVVNDIFVHDGNRVYVAENSGCIDIIIDSKIASTAERGPVVNRFIRSREVVYAITDDIGVAIFDNGLVHERPGQPKKSVQDLVRVNDSLFLILDSDFKALLIDSEFRVFSALDDETTYQSLYADSKNNVWLCAHSEMRLLDRHQTRNEALRFLPLPPMLDHPDLKGADIYNLFEDIDGNYWVSTMKGLFHISRAGNMQRFTTNNGLPTNLVVNLCQDREKNIWGCSQMGLVKIAMKNSFQFISEEAGLTKRIYHLTPDKFGNLFAHNTQDLFLINKQDLSVEKVWESKPVGSIVGHPGGEFVLVVSPGDIWEVSRHGPTIKRGETFSSGHYAEGLVDDMDNLFVSSFYGILVKAPGRATQHFALDTRVTSIYLDDDNCLWAGTWDSGLFRIEIAYSSDRIEAQVEDMTSVVQNRYIRSVFQDQSGKYWIGSRYEGLIMLGQDTTNGWNLERFNKSDGLSSNWIVSLAEGEAGTMWVGTHSGLNKLVHSDDSYKIFNFNRLNNYFGEVYSIHATPGGQIWVGGTSGLIRFQDERIDTTTAPVVHITAALSSGQELDLSRTYPRLRYQSANLTFEFSAPTFLNEDVMLYSYRLCCTSDTSWSRPRNQHAVSFSSLQPGDYAFEVRAYGWNNQPGVITRYPFRVNAPFWKAWWFFWAMGAIGLLTSVALHKYRVYQLLQWQKARDRIASDLHDDIGSSLTNISILSALGRKNVTQPAEVSKYLSRITEEVQASAQAMDDIIWSVNSRHDNLEETIARMRRFTAELLDGTNTRYHLKIEGSIQDLKLSMEKRRDLFLIYKEILSNICKHAGASMVWIRIEFIDHNLSLYIKDNGRGFIEDEFTWRNGIRNMRSRTAKWKAQLHISSSPGEGTIVEFKMPM